MAEILELGLEIAGGIGIAVLLWQSTSKVFIDMCCAFYDQMKGQFERRSST